MSDSVDNEINSPLDALVRQSWAAAMGVGVLSVILGIVVIVWPGPTVLVLAVLIGIQMIFSGIFRLTESLGGVTNSPWLSAIGALLLVAIGVWALRNPSDTASVLGLAIGIAWLISGIVQLFGALFSDYFPHRGWMMIGGVISIVAGVTLLGYPSISIATLAWVTGLYMVIWGVVLLIAGFAARS